jgi:hypothetical protein
MQCDWLISAEHFAGRDSEKKRVTNLAGRTGDSDFNRRSHDSISHSRRTEQYEGRRTNV